MVLFTRIMFIFSLVLFLAAPVSAAQSGKQSSSSSTTQTALREYLEKLKENPTDNALRKKIITLALTMDPAPIVPEQVERTMSRGAAFARNADGAGGYNKAIEEFQTAANNAPWFAIAYFNLGVVQEKVGYYTEAIQNFNWYLMAAPNASNAQDVKNTIYALETELEAARSSGSAESATVVPAQGNGPTASKQMTLAVETVKPQKIIQMPPPSPPPPPPPPVKQKPSVPSFIGNWFYKSTVRGEERTIQAFQISKNAGGSIVAIAPQRTAADISTIRDFAIDDTRIKIAIHWRMTSVVGYWKIERYDLVLSGDGAKLTGSYSEKSVGGRSVERETTLFRGK